MSTTLSSGSLFWTFVLTLVAVLCMATSARALKCAGTPCTDDFDHCCARFSSSSVCCSSNGSSFWFLKGTGIVLGVIFAVLLVIVLREYCRIRRPVQERSCMTSTDDSWDTPPDYNSQMRTFEKEPPGYYKLYPIPVATASGSKESSEPPPPTYEKMNTSWSSKSKDFPRLPWKKSVPSVTFTVCDNKPEIITK